MHILHCTHAKLATASFQYLISSGHKHIMRQTYGGSRGRHHVVVQQVVWSHSHVDGGL